MAREPFGRLDRETELRERLLPLCRLKPGEVWRDPEGKHRLAVLDAAAKGSAEALLQGEKSVLGIHDPPYNIEVGGAKSDLLFRLDVEAYLEFSRGWIANALEAFGENAHLYVFLGADQDRGFQPLPEVMLLLREYGELKSRSFITLRNQRGYGTQKNWMAVRQELLYYVKGDPPFRVVYTDLPKTLKGYYKEVGGRRTENLERSRSDTLRPGNVWIDVQQVFYRMEENVPGAYAQKPLKALERLLLSSSREGDLVTDFFAHSGTTLIAAEKLGRRCYCLEIDPIFAELSIRRLERFRATGKTGWQWEHPFPEIDR